MIAGGKAAFELSAMAYSKHPSAKPRDVCCRSDGLASDNPRGKLYLIIYFVNSLSHNRIFATKMIR
jgi:hypothetical protein